MRVLESIFAKLADPAIMGMARVKAVIELLMLIRFPKGDLEYQAAVLQSSALYLKMKGYSTSKLNEAPDLSEFLFQGLTIKQFVEITSFCQQAHIGFDLIDIGKTTIAESDVKYVSEVVNFILWYEPNRNRHDSRQHASLNKAYVYLYLWCEEKIIVMWSRNTFQKQWDKYAPLSGLIYAMTFYFGERFVLNPEQDDFSVVVDRIANDPQRTNQIIGIASCAYARLRARLKKLSKPIDWPQVSCWEHLFELPAIKLPKEVAERVERDDFYIPNLTRRERIKYGIIR